MNTIDEKLNQIPDSTLEKLAVKEYTNREFLEIEKNTYRELHEKNKLPEISDKTIDQLEWALMLLNEEYANENYIEGISPFNLKTFDGSWLMSAQPFNRESMVFLTSEEELMSGYRFVKDVNTKIMQIDKWATLVKFKYLTEKEKRDYQIMKRFIATKKQAVFYPQKNKWFLSSDCMNFNKLQDYDLTLHPLIEEHHKALEKIRIEGKSEEESNVEVHLTMNNALFDELQGKGFIDNKYPMYMPINPKLMMIKRITMDWIRNNTIEYIQDCINLRLALSLSITSYFEWFVYIRETPKSIGIKIPVHPESTKEIFSMRNIPEGASRKKAICHYVKQHYRTIKNDYSQEERVVMVKKYLRGETKFNWRGLEVNIIPSQDDIDILQPRKQFMKV